MMMFDLNRSMFDIFTIAHAIVPFYIGRRIGSARRWTSATHPILLALGAVVLCEITECFVAWLGIQSFAESPINILGDLMTSIPFSIFGVYIGRSDIESVGSRRRAVAHQPAEKRAKSFSKDTPAASPNPKVPVPTFRIHLAVSVILTLIGLFRFASDIAMDASPEWWHILDGTPFRYLVRAPSDGTFWGNFSVQYVKILFVPCGISILYLRYRFFFSSKRFAQKQWEMWDIRLLYVLGLFVAATWMEIEKSTHIIGFKMAGPLEGEKVWLNHTLHIVSALLGWMLMVWLRVAPKEEISRTKR